MPKAAGRRKRIRTARVEVDPSSLPGSTKEGSTGSATPASKGDRNKQQTQSKKKNQQAGTGEARDKALGPVLQKLSSDSATTTTPSDILWAIAATSHILNTSDAGLRRSLQSKNIVGLLIDKLNDDHNQNVEIKMEAAGALRNLAIEGGAEVCAEMYNKSIVPNLQAQITTISIALNNFLNDIKPENDEEVAVRKVLWVWIEHLATLFWCLAETSDKAFKAIVTIQPLSDLLYEILKHAVPVDGSPVSSSKIPVSVALAAAQAVYVLTDVNVPSAPKFPLPRDVSISAAYANTRSMLLESLRNLSSNLTISSSSLSKATQEQIQSLQVMLIGIYQNLSQQRSFGKQSSNGNDIEAEESEFTRLTLTILINLISNSDIQQDATLAVEAYSSLPDMNPAAQTKTISAEAVEVSPQRRQLDAIEARWTTVRLALEILGEMVAGIDGLLDPALLGKTEEEYEEWNGIQSENGADDSKMDEDGEMDTEDSTASTAAQAQNDLSISTDIRQLLSNLPSILINLGRSSSISFTSPSPSSASKIANNNTHKEEDNLIPTQIDMQTGPETTSNQVEALSSPGTYVPAVSEVFSFVHVRALECLNNLLITLARSGVTPGDGKARDANAETEDEGEEDKDDDDETFRSMSPEALIAGGIEEVGDMDSEDNNASEGETFLQDNLKTLQSVFEDLFHSLLDYQNRYHTALSMTGVVASAKKKDPMLESLELVVEACVGSIWALSRLCGDQLTIGQDEHRLLLNTYQSSLTQSHQNTEIAIRCVGALGQVAMRRTISSEENYAIGTALLTPLNAEQMSRLTGGNVGEIDLISQILDTLFDVYGEETREYDGNVERLGIVRILESILPTFRRLTKSVDKRKYPETRAAAEAALLNLPAYVKYRKDLARKMNRK